MRETTTKAVRQRQLSFSLLANGDDRPLPLARKPKPRCCHLDNTGTATLRDRRPLGARNHLRAWCPIHALKHCQKGLILKENSLGEKRGRDPLAEWETCRSKLPTAPRKRKGVVRSKEKLKFLCTPRVPLTRWAKRMPPPPRSFPATFQPYSRLTIRTEQPCRALVFFYPIRQEWRAVTAVLHMLSPDPGLQTPSLGTW